MIFICPICGTENDCDDRVWFYTCKGCGSGINLIGIWWKTKTDQNWVDQEEDKKKEIGKKYYSDDQKFHSLS